MRFGNVSRSVANKSFTDRVGEEIESPVWMGFTRAICEVEDSASRTPFNVGICLARAGQRNRNESAALRIIKSTKNQVMTDGIGKLIRFRSNITFCDCVETVPFYVISRNVRGFRFAQILLEDQRPFLSMETRSRTCP
jgi:hypothetical protein